MSQRRVLGSGFHMGASEPGDDDDAAVADRFRDAFQRWAATVTIVAARDDDGSVHATTVTSIAPLSASPPLLVVCLGAGAQVLPFAGTGSAVGVSVLGEDQKRWASIFADPLPVATPEWPDDPAPLLPGAVAGLRCTVVAVHAAEGSSRLVVGRVDGIELGDQERPLLYWMRAYRKLGEP